MTLKKVRYLVMLICFMMVITGCASESNIAEEKKLPISENFFIFDTIVSIRVYDERVNEQHFTDMKQLLEEIDQKMNRMVEGSEVSEVNKQAGKAAVTVSEDTFLVIKTAKDYAEQSAGSFDPTIGPLVDLWAIGNGGTTVPERAKITAAQSLIDYNNLVLDENKLEIKLLEAGMTIDLGAIAKGYAADVIAAYLQEQGFESAIIDLGGNILAMGSKPGGQAWSIGVQSPEEKRGDHLGTLPVTNKTVVTSGVYERYFIENEQVYHHVLDRKTGFPVQNELASVTIVTENSMNADALSTATFVLGLKQGMAFIEQLDYAEAIFVTNDHQVYISTDLKDKFTLTNSNYSLAEF
ncbi:FAD:protein FMN transferase [Paenibacillus yanchengensis]|uniref:FAD:protein FMN transferase n=1 Tax=Paenibacillus yanchengensis TaxID=2035833 RepID=A0ABW4YP45_9BACL